MPAVPGAGSATSAVPSRLRRHEWRTTQSLPARVARTWLQPASGAIPVDRLFDSLREAHAGRPLQVASGIGAVTHPLVEELVALVAGEHHRAVGELAIGLTHEGRPEDDALGQRDPQKCTFAERG